MRTAVMTVAVTMTAAMRIAALRIVAMMTEEVVMTITTTLTAIVRATDTRTPAMTIVPVTITSDTTDTDILHSRSTWAATTLPTIRTMTRIPHRPIPFSPTIPTHRTPSKTAIRPKRTTIHRITRRAATMLFVKKQINRIHYPAPLPNSMENVCARTTANSAATITQAI